MDNSDYRITVKTGDVKDVDVVTDAKASIILHGGQGRKSDEIPLNIVLKNDLERGRIDTFAYSDIANIGDIGKIELRRDATGSAGDWYVDVVEVEHASSKKYFFQSIDGSMGHIIFKNSIAVYRRMIHTHSNAEKSWP
ncbi:lipoxygenase homology domain-containing protein 1-like [Ptychodera flava]|uniref:lipoxygenase homology domain-containing protein 1-like n=1 Tax=Ptychodera flava TaxID=63121 RepID=UPI00396A5028